MNWFQNSGRIKISFATGLIGTGIYGDLVYKFRKIVSRANFLINSETLSCVINVLDIIVL